MLSFPNAKINLGLNIISRRPDGYHNLESCFYPIPWTDILEITKDETFSFVSTGLDIPGDTGLNLCVKAYQLIAEKYNISPVHIHLHKAIPMGAGLGGGSSDGAFTIKMLNDLFDLKLKQETMKELAALLGSDCPFFIENKPVFATGTGTSLQPVNCSLSGKYIALKHPHIHIGTGEAYGNIVPRKPQISVPEILNNPITTWKDQLINDFEASIFPAHPEIKSLKDKLYQAGAIYASMTGSGSAVYGIFEHKPNLPEFHILKL